MGVDAFTEALRLIVYFVAGLALVAAAAFGVEKVAAGVRRRRRRPWWRSEARSGRSDVQGWPR